MWSGLDYQDVPNLPSWYRLAGHEGYRASRRHTPFSSTPRHTSAVPAHIQPTSSRLA